MPDSSEHTKDDQDSNNHSDDEETKNKPVGFGHPSLRKTHKAVVIAWSKTLLILSAFILAVLSLYWAVLFPVTGNLEAFKVAVVSFDGQLPPYSGTEPLVGQAVAKAVNEQLEFPKGILGYVIQSPEEYNNDPLNVRRAVYEEKYFAAVIVSNNASALLQRAVATGNRQYDPLGAGQIIINDARDQTAYSSYITPQLSALQINIQAQFGEKWVERVLSNSSLSPSTYQQCPQALNPAIGFSMINLRPFGPPAATPAVTIGLIYLIIIAFFSFSFFLPLYTKYIIPEGHPPMHFYQLVLWRYAATLMVYLILSLSYSFVSLAFQIPFSNSFAHNDITRANNPDAYGKATFVVYWMLNFVGMIALGLASENVTMVVGQPYSALWLIFWVISNVSTSFYPIVTAPGFFKWGYAWPLHQIVSASRTLLFDTHNELGLNFGILLAWCAANTALFPVCCLFMRYKANKEEIERRSGLRREIRYLVDG